MKVSCLKPLHETGFTLGAKPGGQGIQKIKFRRKTHYASRHTAVSQSYNMGCFMYGNLGQTLEKNLRRYFFTIRVAPESMKGYHGGFAFELCLPVNKAQKRQAEVTIYYPQAKYISVKVLT